MKPRALMLTLGVAWGLLSHAPHAHADTMVKNNWQNLVHVAYAYASIHGFGCGYETCNDNFRVQGYWDVQPGQTITVNGHTHYNGTHWFFVFDDFGNVWDGDGTFPIFPVGTNFDICYSVGDFPAGSSQANFAGTGPDCCGLNCAGPSDFTFEVNP